MAVSVRPPETCPRRPSGRVPPTSVPKSALPPTPPPAELIARLLPRSGLRARSGGAGSATVQGCRLGEGLARSARHRLSAEGPARRVADVLKVRCADVSPGGRVGAPVSCPARSRLGAGSVEPARVR